LPGDVDPIRLLVNDHHAVFTGRVFLYLGNVQGTIDDITTHFANVIYSATIKLKPHNPYHGGIIPVKQCGNIRSLIGRERILLVSTRLL